MLADKLDPVFATIIVSILFLCAFAIAVMLIWLGFSLLMEMHIDHKKAKLEYKIAKEKQNVQK